MCVCVCVCVFMYSAFKYKKSPSFPESTVFFPKTNRSDMLPYKDFPSH